MASKNSTDLFRQPAPCLRLVAAAVGLPARLHLVLVGDGPESALHKPVTQLRHPPEAVDRLSDRSDDGDAALPVDPPPPVRTTGPLRVAP